MINQQPKGAEASSSKFSSAFAAIIIPVAVGVGFLVYYFILGNTSHFEGGDPKGHPLFSDLQNL